LTAKPTTVYSTFVSTFSASPKTIVNTVTSTFLSTFVSSAQPQTTTLFSTIIIPGRPNTHTSTLLVTQKASTVISTITSTYVSTAVSFSTVTPVPSPPPPTSASFIPAVSGTQPEFTLPTLYSFPNGTAINGLATLSDGTLMISLPERAEIYALDPLAQVPHPVLAHRFPPKSKILCMTEISRNRLGVLVTPPSANDENPTPVLWNLRVGAFEGVSVNRIGEVMEGENFVSLLALSKTTLLASNSNGAVHRITTASGNETALFTDPSMIPSIGGIRYKEPYLYFVNTVQGLFARIQINPENGDAVAPVETIATGMAGLQDVALAPFADHVAALINYEQNSVLKVDANAKVSTVAKGWKAPTAAQFGRTEDDSSTLYVVTSGSVGVPGNVMMIKFEDKQSGRLEDGEHKKL
jgi:hypothetical protein